MKIKFDVSRPCSKQFICYEKSIFESDFHMYLIIDNEVAYRERALYPRDWLAFAMRSSRESGIRYFYDND